MKNVHALALKHDVNERFREVKTIYLIRGNDMIIINRPNDCIFIFSIFNRT